MLRRLVSLFTLLPNQNPTKPPYRRLRRRRCVLCCAAWYRFLHSYQIKTPLNRPIGGCAAVCCCYGLNSKIFIKIINKYFQSSPPF
jgi:hypothetical protein